MKFIISLALLSALAVCQVKSQGRIIGPTIVPTEQRDISHVALFKRDRPNVAFCSGILISYEWVLTAASCVTDIYNEDIRVKVGGRTIDIPTDPTGSTQFSSAERVTVIPHPQYNALYLANDIALLRLRDSLEKNSVLPYAPAARDDIWVGKRVIIRGFGSLEPYGEQNGALVLTEMRTTVQQIAECRREILNVPANKVCISGSRICDGDQGSPVLLETTNELIGIVSTPPAQRENCGSGSGRATYTNIIPYKPWLRIQTGIQIP